MKKTIKMNKLIHTFKNPSFEITFTFRKTYINKELICDMLGITGYKRTEILFPKKKKRGSKRRRRKTK